jgi:hypothetical protein
LHKRSDLLRNAFLLYSNRIMKKISAITVIALSLIFLSSKSVDQKRFIIGSGTRLTIHGQTNVNKFQCKMNGYTSFDTLDYTTDDDGCMLFFKHNQMLIPVVSFDCANKMINKDFYDVLKAGQHPHIAIQFVALERWTGDNKIGGTAYITLAGVTKPFTIQYEVNSTARQLLLKGLQHISFSDFGLQAPEKMMGLIKVQDKLLVEFHLVLRPI